LTWKIGNRSQLAIATNKRRRLKRQTIDRVLRAARPLRGIRRMMFGHNQWLALAHRRLRCIVSFNRPNVTLIDLNGAPLEEITRDGLIAGGKTYQLDAIIYAIGFDAMTGALTRIDIRGKGGETLADKWAEGPRTYLGLCVAGFPNLFTITGPGSPSVLTNMLPTIEQHVEWIADCIGHMREKGVSRIGATPQAEADWVAHVNEIAAGTLFPTANSWYLGANIPGKPRVFMPYIGFPPYVAKCNEVVANGYAGFTLS